MGLEKRSKERRGEKRKKRGEEKRGERRIGKGEEDRGGKVREDRR